MARSAALAPAAHGTSDPFGRQVAAIFIAQAATVLLNLLTGIVIARTLGAAGKGSVALAMLVPGFLSLALSGGVGMANVYLAASRRHAPSALAGTSLLVTAVASVVGWGAIALGTGAGWLERVLPGVAAPLVMVAAAALPAMLLSGYYGALLQAFRRMATLGALTAAQAATVLALTVLLVVGLHRGVAGAVAAAAAGTVLGTLLLTRALVSAGVRLRPVWDPVVARAALGFGLQGHLSNVLQFFTYRLDMFLVGAMVGVPAAGLYSVAVTLAELLWHLPNAVGFVTFPRAAAATEADLAVSTPRALRGTLLLTAAGAALLATAGRPLITGIFSPAFEGAYRPLLVLLPGVVLLGGAKVLSNELAGRGLPIYNTATAAAAFLVTVVLDLVLIPRRGIVGAAAASSLAYALTAAMTLGWHRRLRQRAARPPRAPRAAAMRIAYLVTWNPGPASGVLKKIDDQVRRWRNLGSEVCVWMLSPAGVPVPDRVGGARVIVESGGTWRERLRALDAAANAMMAWEPDVAYLRHDYYYPALARLADAIPTVAEINADDVREYRLAQTRRWYWYNRLTRGRLLRRLRGMVFVSEDLARKGVFARYGKPYVVVANGIDLARYRVLPPPANAAPRLVFIGSAAQPWFGLDKVVWLARRFPAWGFDLIGIEPVALAAAPANVTAHGVLDQTRYEAIMAGADVAIGSLAYHRVGMDEASTLKVREYLAYGLPVILGCPDTDFPAPRPFLLVLPNTLDNVQTSAERIAAFVEQVRGRRVPRAEVAHLDVAAKETTRLAFLRQVAAGPEAAVAQQGGSEYAAR